MGKELQAVDADMSEVRDIIVTMAAGRPDAIAKLNKTRTAWRAYR